MPRKRRRSLLDDFEASTSGDALTTSGSLNDSRNDASYHSTNFKNNLTKEEGSHTPNSENDSSHHIQHRSSRYLYLVCYILHVT